MLPRSDSAKRLIIRLIPGNWLVLFSNVFAPLNQCWKLDLSAIFVQVLCSGMTWPKQTLYWRRRRCQAINTLSHCLTAGQKKVLGRNTKDTKTEIAQIWEQIQAAGAKGRVVNSFVQRFFSVGLSPCQRHVLQISLFVALTTLYCLGSS